MGINIELKPNQGFEIDNVKDVFHRSKQLTYRKDKGSVDINFNDISIKVHAWLGLW